MIFVVRHAESEANVGLATSNPEKISITKSGEDLSAKFADEIEINADLIVISRHYRTLQTAQPLIEKYPQAILETWAIHEFTYLAPSACIDTTKEDRKTRVEEYWDKCDPDFVDGLGAESFATFFKRVQGCFNRMKVLGDSNAYFFSHEQFIKLIEMLRKGVIADASVESMKIFRNALSTKSIKNLEVLRFEIKGDVVATIPIRHKSGSSVCYFLLEKRCFGENRDCFPEVEFKVGKGKLSIRQYEKKISLVTKKRAYKEFKGRKFYRDFKTNNVGYAWFFVLDQDLILKAERSIRGDSILVKVSENIIELSDFVKDAVIPETRHLFVEWSKDRILTRDDLKTSIDQFCLQDAINKILFERAQNTQEEDKIDDNEEYKNAINNSEKLSRSNATVKVRIVSDIQEIFSDAKWRLLRKKPNLGFIRTLASEEIINSSIFKLGENSDLIDCTPEKAYDYLSQMKFSGLEKTDQKYFKIIFKIYFRNARLMCQAPNKLHPFILRVAKAYCDNFNNGLNISDLFWIGKIVKFLMVNYKGHSTVGTEVILLIGRKDINERQLSPLTNYRKSVKNITGFDRENFVDMVNDIYLDTEEFKIVPLSVWDYLAELPDVEN